MTKCIQIRNNNSSKVVKPRVFDFLVEDDVMYLVIKNGKSYERILWSDVLYQILNGLLSEYVPSPEPQC